MARKYELIVINGFEQKSRTEYKSRNLAIKEVENILKNKDNQVEEIIYHDERKHKQELICSNDLRFLINRL